MHREKKEREREKEREKKKYLETLGPVFHGNAAHVNRRSARNKKKKDHFFLLEVSSRGL